MILISLIFLVIINYNVVDSLHCKNEDGKKVHYFVNLKPPSQKYDHPHIKTGYGYLYKTSDDGKSEFINSDREINKESSMIGITFKEVYDDHLSYSYIQFNDESPFNLAGDDRVSRSLKNSVKHLFKKIPILGAKYAIARGSLVWNSEGAILFLTSAPKYLPLFNKGKYKYSNLFVQRKEHYFVCVSLKLEAINKVLNQLIVIEPKVYAYNLDKDISLDTETKFRLKENLGLVAGKKDSSKIDHQDIDQPPSKKTSSNFRQANELKTEILIGNSNNIKVHMMSNSREVAVDIRARITSSSMKASLLKDKASSLLQKLKSKNCSKTETLLKPYNYLFGKRSNRDTGKVYWPLNDEKINIVTSGDQKGLCFGLFKNLNYNRGNMNVCIDDDALRDAYSKLMDSQNGNC